MKTEEWFGDLSDDDEHEKIEQWEEFDNALTERGMTFEERREYWRALDPDTPVLDWANKLMASGHTAQEAQEIIRAFGGEQ